MSIVYLHGAKLWVEGERAYSIDEITAALESATESKVKLEGHLNEVLTKLDELAIDRDATTAQLKEAEDQIAFATAILEKVKKVESSEAEIEAVDAAEDQPAVLVAANDDELSKVIEEADSEVVEVAEVKAPFKPLFKKINKSHNQEAPIVVGKKIVF